MLINCSTMNGGVYSVRYSLMLIQNHVVGLHYWIILIMRTLCLKWSNETGGWISIVHVNLPVSCDPWQCVAWGDSAQIPKYLLKASDIVRHSNNSNYPSIIILGLEVIWKHWKSYSYKPWNATQIYQTRRYHCWKSFTSDLVCLMNH